MKVLIGGLGLLALLIAAPVEFSDDAGLLGPNLAAAKQGNGKGGGNGNGRGKGQGPAADQSVGEQNAAHGRSKDAKSNGQANGRAVGHAAKDAVSGVEQTPPGHAKKAAYDGMKGNLGIQGSFNAIHSAAINKGVVAPQSRVAEVKSYLDAAQEVSDIENGQDDTNNTDLEAAIEAAAVAAANASSQTVTSDMLGQVHAYSNANELTEPGIDMTDPTRDSIAEQAEGTQSGS